MTQRVIDADGDMIPVAFLGRTSSAEVQDPTLSIPRQLNEVQDKLPPGCVIVAHYWDVESGGLALEDRGRGRAHEQFDVPVPRDGGLLDLRREAANPDRPFAAVMCSAIERSARENLDSLQLERDLERLGVPLLAADEPLAFDRSNPSTILFRRFKQGIAEWYRLDLKKNAWSGMRAHTEQGWNTGPVPYGYLAEKVPHPVPAKRAEGKTKTRLVVDPGRAHVVPLIFEWRVVGRMGYEAIRDRLNSDPSAYPPPRNANQENEAGVWTWGTVRNILANPKYTGFMVWNLEKGKGGKFRQNDRSEWVWSPEPSHPALVSRELFDRAAEVARDTERSRQGHSVNSCPGTQRTYVLRSFVRCAICGRRMIGKDRRGTTYYRCKTDHTDPRTLERYPDHPNGVLVKEELLHWTVETFFAEHIFGPRRGELFREHFDEAAARAHAEHAERVTGLEARLAAAEKAKRRLIGELETLPDDDEMAAAMRAGIHERFRERESERRALVVELETLNAHKPEAPEDPSVLEELPTLPLTLAGVAEDVQRELFGAFGLVVEYDKRRNAVELCVTVTTNLLDVVRMLEGAQRGALAGTPLLPYPPPRGGRDLPELPRSGRTG